MNFVPKEDQENYNVSESNTLLDFILLILGAAALVLIGYLLFGWAGEKIFTSMSVERENKLFSKFDPFGSSLKKLDVKQINSVFNKIKDKSKIDVNIFLLCESQPNAFAFPGGKMGVTSGLFNIVNTEIGLAFVLAHELGHFKNRDHMRGLGRNLGIIIMTQFIGLSTSTDATENLVNLVLQRTNSRSQEEEADLFAIGLIKDIYGQMNGAEEFFENLQNDKNAKIAEMIPLIFKTHPGTQERIDLIKKQSTGKPSSPRLSVKEEIFTLCKR